MTVLKSRRVGSGNPPSAAQIKRPFAARSGPHWACWPAWTTWPRPSNWDSLLPHVVADVMKHKGSYIAVPVNVHRVKLAVDQPRGVQKAVPRYPRIGMSFSKPLRR